jgi:hypothetical protein
VKTLVAAAEPPERPRNMPLPWVSNTTASAGCNMRVDWMRLDTRQ